MPRHSGEEVVSLRVTDGRLDAAAGTRPGADAVIEAAPETVFQLVSGELAPADAVACGEVRLEGEPAALGRFASLFTIEPRSHELQDRDHADGPTGRSPASLGAASRTG